MWAGWVRSKGVPLAWLIDKKKMKTNVPGTDLQIESRKIEEVIISGLDLRECLEYVHKHGLKYQDMSTQEYVVQGEGNTAVGVHCLFAVRAIRELSLVEA